MEQLLLIVYVLLSAAMIGLILLQQGKGADMGASFGSGASQTVFGSAGTGNVLSRSTAILAALFFAASVGLALVAKHKAEALRDASIPVPAVVETREVPELPAAPALLVTNRSNSVACICPHIIEPQDFHRQLYGPISSFEPKMRQPGMGMSRNCVHSPKACGADQVVYGTMWMLGSVRNYVAIPSALGTKGRSWG